MTAVPETCGACEHYVAAGDVCTHPAHPRPVHGPLTIYTTDPPPFLCPLRRAAEIAQAEERGARWAIRYMDRHDPPDDIDDDETIAATVCAEARAKENTR